MAQKSLRVGARGGSLTRSARPLLRVSKVKALETVVQGISTDDQTKLDVLEKRFRAFDTDW
jgi:hypothetical protein